MAVKTPKEWEQMECVKTKGGCYVIGKTENSDLGYFIVGRITYSVYNKYKRRLEENVKRARELARGLVADYDKRNRQGDSSGGSGQGFDFDATRYSKQNNGVQRMGENETVQLGIKDDTERNNARNGGDRAYNGIVDIHTDAINKATLNFLINGNRADTATCANVLNVIDSFEARVKVVLEVAKAIKPQGKVFFMVYEGDGSGIGRQTSKGGQNNRKTSDYVKEIELYFESVERRGKMIIAQQPKDDLPAASWEVSIGKAYNYPLDVYENDAAEFTPGRKKYLNSMIEVV